MTRFPVIIGPTAGGKSSLAVNLCLALAARSGGARRAEVVTADSMQVYRGMDIGTAKPTVNERAGVPHHLIDLVEPDQPFSVDQWLKKANALIDGMRARGVVPVVVGGTNLYVKALLEGLFEGPAADPDLRERLGAMDPAQRRAELERVDPAAAERIHFNDVRRTVRALEVFHLTGRPISAHQSQWGVEGSVRPDVLVIGLDWPAEAINRRINARVKQMVEAGFIEEVRGLLARGVLPLGSQAREALGYKQVAAALEAGGSPRQIEDAVERTKIETRRFAKNQRTWLKRFRVLPAEGSGARAVWLDGADGALTEHALAALEADRAPSPESRA